MYHCISTMVRADTNTNKLFNWLWFRNLIKIIEDYADLDLIKEKVSSSLKSYLSFLEVEIFIFGNLNQEQPDGSEIMQELIDSEFFDRRLIEDVLISKSPSRVGSYQITFPLELRGRVIGLFHLKSFDELSEEHISLLWAFADQLAIKVDELQMPNNLNTLSKIKIKQISDSIFNNLKNFLEASLVKLKVLEQKNQELVEINKFKVDLINNVSHELRTPLVGILGFSNMLQRHQNSPEIINEASLQIVDASNRLSRMIDDLIQLNRANNIGWQVSFEKVDFKEMIEFALKTLAPLQTNHQFNFNFNDNLAALRADKKLLLQIIENLLTNAIKYSPDGGEILISAHSDSKHFHFSVSDHGIGMTEEDVAKIFDRFYRVKSAKTNKIHGLGLGLAICKDLITALDGEISCKSILGEGSTFTIRLPLYL